MLINDRKTSIFANRRPADPSDTTDVAVLINDEWNEQRTRLIARAAALVAYHQATIAAADASHAKRRIKRLRQRGIALDHCITCQNKVGL